MHNGFPFFYRTLASLDKRRWGGHPHVVRSQLEISSGKFFRGKFILDSAFLAPDAIIL